MVANDLVSSQKEVLTCTEVAELIGSHPNTIRLQAREDPSKLGFPVIVLGNRVKIPRRPFLKWMGVIE